MFGGFRTDERGSLRVGEFRASELAERFGTPLFVMDGERIRENYRRFREAFSGWGEVVIAYACKANSNLAVCRLLQLEGAGAEVVSEGELRLALKAGFPPEKIFFNGNAKSEREIELAVERGVKLNLDSLEEVEVVGEVCRRLGKKTEVGLRVNPGVEVPTHPYIATGGRESKFGMELETGEALEGFRLALKEGLPVRGIHCHLGSQLLELSPFEEGAERVMEFVASLKEGPGAGAGVRGPGGRAGGAGEARGEGPLPAGPGLQDPSRAEEVEGEGGPEALHAGAGAGEVPGERCRATAPEGGVREAQKGEAHLGLRGRGDQPADQARPPGDLLPHGDGGEDGGGGEGDGQRGGTPLPGGGRDREGEEAAPAQEGGPAGGLQRGGLHLHHEQPVQPQAQAGHGDGGGGEGWR
jgi:hypothetical protein